MVSRKGEGLASAGSSKFRAISLVLLVVAIAVAAYVYLVHVRETKVIEEGASLKKIGGIKSVPGSETTTPEYVKLLREQTIQEATEAERTGKSVIATVVRPSYRSDEFADPVNVKKGCSLAELKRAREAGVSAYELRCRGCSAAALRAAGYTAGELRAAGFNADELKRAGFSAAELRAAGFSAQQLKEAGYSITDLVAAGATPCDLLNSGYSEDEIKFAGFTDADLKKIGIGTPPANLPSDCNENSLRKARNDGITPAQMRNLKCGASAFRGAGFTAKEMRDSCYTVAQLRAAGYTAAELRAAGFSAGELLAAGFTPKELREAGFSAKDLRDAGVSAEDLVAAGYNVDELREAGFSDGDLKRAGVSSTLLVSKDEYCSPSNIKKLQAQNVPPADILAKCGNSEEVLSAMLAAGYSEQALLAAGVSAEALARAKLAVPFIASSDMCSPANIQKLKARNVPASAIVALCGDNPAVLAAMRAAGYTADELAEAGINPDQLAAAGFTAGEVGQVAQAQARALTPEEQLIADVERQAAEQLTAQQREDRIQRMSEAMRGAASTLFETWSPPETHQYVEAPEVKKKENEGDGEASGSGVGNAGSVQQRLNQAASATAQGPVLPLKAGDILFAVLDTGINSDEVSPILATVVQGKLKGAKLVGSFSTAEKKVVLNFTLMNVPWYTTSIPVNIVAIDPETARTAIANEVDNHYLQRFGGLFASSFLSGIAEAISSSGQQQSSGAGGLLTTTDQLSTGEQIAVALGNVGTEYANILGESFTRKPTVKVKAGVGLGLLFMQDAQIPLPSETDL